MVFLPHYSLHVLKLIIPFETLLTTCLSLVSTFGLHRCVLLTVPGSILLKTMACLCGLVTFAYYTDKGCDPLGAGYITNPNQVGLVVLIIFGGRGNSTVVRVSVYQAGDPGSRPP